MQRYFSDKKIDNKLEIKKDDLYHIKTVMRMKNNELIEVVYNEELYICKVNLDSNMVDIERKIENTNNDFDVTLVIPLLKEAKMDLIMQKSTELGVSKIIPIETERSVIKFEKSKFDKKRERWQKICKEASEQSKRLTIPIVENLTSFDELGMLEGVKLVCSTTEKQKNLKNLLQTNDKYVKLILVIGPEGGFTASEEKKFVENGFERISLGNRIMRVETVPMFLLSIINYIYME